MNNNEIIYKTAVEQVSYLKKNGLLFLEINENEAVKYLTEYTYYHKVISYKNLLSMYDTNEKGTDIFNGIDFADLYQLQLIDQKLRESFSQITLKLEYYFKVFLMNQVEMEKVCLKDPYYYYHILDVDRRFNVTNKIKKRAIDYGDIYSKKMLEQYPGKKPVWVLNEYLSFGEVIEIYATFVRKNHIKNKEFFIDLLIEIKSLRNMSVHNNSLLNSRGIGKKDTKKLIEKYKSDFGVVITDGILHSYFIYEVACLLYLYKLISPEDIYQDDINNLYNNLHEIIKKNNIFKKYSGEDVLATIRTIEKLTNKMY